MKKLFGISLLMLGFLACAPGIGTNTTQSSSTTISAEAQARELTNKMKNVLNLDRSQEDRILSINVINQKLLQRIRQNNEQSIAVSTKENYHKELKEVLSADQFTKFRNTFPEL